MSTRSDSLHLYDCLVLFDKPVASSLGLAALLSTIALVDISMWAAFLANLGLLVFFFVYAVAFTWAFDTVFGPPASAIRRR